MKKKYTNLPDNYCLQGKPSATYKEKLKNFALGPCSPLIIAPGLNSTKLIVEIQCETLRDENKDIFNQCGWTDCHKKVYEFWKKVPKKEYKLWINDLLSPISVFGNLQANLCIAKIFRTMYNFQQADEKWILQSKGFRILASGFSNETRHKNKCGAESIQNLLPLPIQIKQTYAFAPLIQELERIGYTTGITYQAMPYNFYLTVYQNEFTINFKNQVERIYKLVGKKITILAHSNGNLLTMYNLHKFFDQSEKEKYFRNYLALTPPFLGTYQANKILLGGNDSLINSTNSIGFKWNASKIFANSESSIYFLFAKNYLEQYKNETWYQKVEQRKQYEQDEKIPYEQSGILFWPPKDKICYKDNSKAFPQECKLELENPEEDIIFIGDEEKYNLKNYKQVFYKHDNEEIVYQLYEKTTLLNLSKANPGIPVILGFIGLVKSDFKVHFNEKYDYYSSHNTYPKIDYIESVRGDGVVNMSSAILPGLRWALKSDEGDENYKKVTFVELCSQQNNNKEIFDTQKSDGRKFIEQNKYVGIQCECSSQNKKDYNDCNHSNIISDRYFVELVIKVIDIGDKSDEKQLNIIDNMDEQYLKEMSELCNHYKFDIFQEDQTKNKSLIKKFKLLQK